MRRNRGFNRGFTLLELIAVVVILAVIGALGSQFVASALENYNLTLQRGKLVAHARQALERMSRQLRQALPNSVRITNSSQCVEFLPIVAGGHYVSSLPDASNLAPGISSIDSGGYQLGLGSARYFYVGALGAGEIYAANAAGAALSVTEDHSDTIISLASSQRFLRNSISRRFYLTDDPVAFCLGGGDLRVHAGYATPVSSSGLPTGTGVLLAEGVSADAPAFSLSQSSEDRNTVLSISLLFTRAGESIALNQEVFIRNVP